MVSEPVIQPLLNPSLRTFHASTIFCLCWSNLGPCQALLCASKPYWALAFWLSAAINVSRATVLRSTQPRRPRQADPSETWMAIYSHQAPSDQRWSAPKNVICSKWMHTSKMCNCAQVKFCLIERRWWEHFHRSPGSGRRSLQASEVSGHAGHAGPAPFIHSLSFFHTHIEKKLDSQIVNASLGGSKHPASHHSTPRDWIVQRCAKLKLLSSSAAAPKPIL